jgi:DNA-binding NarL/FixJ family response regulator
MINIFITDDHPFVREGLKKTLKEESDINVCGEARNGEELLKLLDKQEADAVVLDVSMPGRNGLDILSEIKSRWPKTVVIILSMYPEEHFAVRAIKNGASGYVTKDSAPYDLVKAIRKGMAGGKYITQSVGEQLAAEVGRRTVSLKFFA